MEQSESGQGTLQRQNSRVDLSHQSISIADYNPQPVDMANLTLSRDMQTMAERLAENAHDMWAKSAKEESEALGGCIHPQMVCILIGFRVLFVILLIDWFSGAVRFVNG